MNVFEMLCENEDAHRLWMMMFRAAHLWDDLVDKDREVTEEEANAVFWDMLVEMPMNPFYQQHFQLLYPLVINACMAYKTSVYYEKNKDEKGLEVGHVLRYNVANVLAQMILICGGKEHADEVLPDLYKLAVDDRLMEYLDENT